MVKKGIKLSSFVTISLICIMIGTAVIPSTFAVDIDRIMGCDKGPSSKPVIPLKKATFVQYDKDTILDDYAYLAAVPTAVFNYEDKLVSHPL